MPLTFKKMTSDKIMYHLSILFFISTGTMTTILNSIILKKKYRYKYGLSLEFNKPIFQTFVMFTGLMLFSCALFCKKKLSHFRSDNITSEQNKVKKWRIIRVSSVPSILCIIASILQAYTLRIMSTTLWQVFHGFRVLFTSVFYIYLMKQHLFLVDWLSLFLTVFGILLPGVAYLIRGNKDDTGSETVDLFFAFVLSIVSHAITALKTVLEEKIIRNYDVVPSRLASYEGVWGFLIFLFIVLPLAQSSLTSILSEDTIDSLKRFLYSLALTLFILSYLIHVTLYSFSGIYITSSASAIHTNIFETIRPVFVWIITIILHYTVDKDVFEEKIDAFTTLEMTGFLITLAGSLIYNRFIRFPCFYYDDEESELSMDNNSYEKKPLLSSERLIDY